jgi:hypothetical protein
MGTRPPSRSRHRSRSHRGSTAAALPPARHRGRTWLIVSGGLLLVLALAVAATLFAFSQIGRTPGELIDYAKRRLQGHPKLELVALPMLDQLRDSLGEPDEIEHRLPFDVPPLPANPMQPPATAAEPPAAAASVLRVGPSRTIRTLAEAARRATNGSTVEIDPGDYRADVAVWRQSDLTIRGSGEQVRLIASGAHAEGKAIWVVQGDRVTIEGIHFVGTRVPDNNGAGIRLERGSLVVRRCSFFDNEMGILTSNEGTARLEVEQSEFGYQNNAAGISHAIYVGTIASFRLSGSWVHNVNRGHLVKSRASKNRIEYNRLTDESGGRASYELELPNGGEAEVVGNLIQQGTGTSNSVIVSYGAEGLHWPVNTLRFVHNTVVNDRPHGGTFLRVAPGTQAVTLRNNLWVGAGRVDAMAGADAAGDERATWEDLARPSREDYRLNAAARDRLRARTPAPVDAAWAPRREYAHPLATRPLAEPARWPGALQSPGP